MNLLKKIIIFLFFVNFAILNGYAITPSTEPALTLKDCIEKALNNSPVIKRAKINYEMSKKSVKIAQSAYFPTLSAGVGYNYTNKSGSSSTTGNAFNANAGIKQLIWNFGKTTANINMKKFNKIVASYDFDDIVLDTILGIKVRYYTTLATKAAIEVDMSNLQISERNYQRTNAYFQEGLKSKIDLVNAEVSVTQAKVSLISAEKNYKDALSLLNNAMYLAYNPEYNIEIPENFKQLANITPKSLTELPRPIEDFLAPPDDISDAKLSANVTTTDYTTLYKFEKFPYTFEECIQLAEKNRPDIKSYTATIKVMEESLNYIKRQYFPELSASGTYNFNGGNTDNKSSNASTFGVGVNLSSSVNIMSEKYEIDNAKLQVELAENELALLKQDVYFDVQRAYINMMEYEEQIPLLEQKIAQTLENLELADGRYAVGLGDYIQLQDARVNYNSAQHAFVKAVFNYNVAKANLEKEIALQQETTIKLEGKTK